MISSNVSSDLILYVANNMPDEEEQRKAKSAVTRGLSDQATMKQLSSSGGAAKAARKKTAEQRAEQAGNEAKQGK